jgi:hypothetical protein
LLVFFATATFAQGGPSHDTLACDPEKNLCAKGWIPPTGSAGDSYIYRSPETHHLTYAKNGGPEFDIDEAYDKFLAEQSKPKDKPHRTGKFQTACVYEMSDGSKDFDACPDGPTTGTIHFGPWIKEHDAVAPLPEKSPPVVLAGPCPNGECK